MLVAYASGHPRVKELVGATLGKLGVGPAALFSTLGRIAARASKPGAGREDGRLGRGARGQHGAPRLPHPRWVKVGSSTWRQDATGAGFHEAPRGALGHWVHIRDGAIANYQCVVPSTWNAGPRDAQGQRGPYEEALLGTPVADAARPLEILRTVHSFDPCMACGVHVVDANRREIASVRAL
jgi:[NiFe] hydrogenase large subunit/hydrogenase large subunit